RAEEGRELSEEKSKDDYVTVRLPNKPLFFPPIATFFCFFSGENTCVPIALRREGISTWAILERTWTSMEFADRGEPSSSRRGTPTTVFRYKHHHPLRI